MYKDKVIDDLSKRWEKSGLVNGDIFLLISSVKRLVLEFKKKKKDISIDQIIESFLNVIGKSGTMLVPLFNFDFTKNGYFSVNDTVSQMGALSERFRIKYSAVRTCHPVYSFGVCGKKKNLFSDIDNFSAYGKDSPFGILKNLNGKIAVLDLEDQNSMTYYHYIEEMNKVEWRYFKKFKGLCVDKNGFKKNKEYSIFVRNLEKKIKTNVNPTGELLWKNNLYSGSRPITGNGLRVIKTREMYSFVSNIIKENQAYGNLYISEN